MFPRPRRIETELSRDVLNPARVTLSWANSPTLGTYSSPRMRRADIEVPNLPVAVNAWERSACYPRGSFYPLIHGPSTRNRRVTLPDFRPCSACRPHSQAPLYQCARRLISIQPEGTFGRLRYLLGGDRPSQTAHQALSPAYAGLGGRLGKSGISRLAPSDPETGVRSLPPILRIPGPPSTPSYSKAPRGLFVLQRVTSIFTGPAISPSPPLRQCPTRDTFRAGRNLPDKEFRYLRTVIVTAAVHRGFGRRLPCHQVTNFLDLPALGRRQPPYMVLRLCGDLCFW